MRGDRFRISVGGPSIEPKWAALRRAVRAVFDRHDRAHARWYTYVENADGERTAREWPDGDVARQAYAGVQSSPGELYIALFDAADPTWPDPIAHWYRAPADQVAVSGDHDAAWHINREANDLFWARTHYKEGKPLDMNDPTDRVMIPLWLAAHADVVAAWKPSASSTAVSGLRSDIVGAPGEPRESRGRIGPKQAAIYGQTNGRFWNETHYKLGLNLNPRDPEDARWIPTWQRIYHEVLAEVYAGLRTHTDPPWMNYSASAAAAREAGSVEPRESRGSVEPRDSRGGPSIPDRWHPGQTIDAPVSGFEPLMLYGLIAWGLGLYNSFQISDLKDELRKIGRPTDHLVGIAPTIQSAEAINHAADVLFWTETKYKPNTRLNPRDPDDRLMIPKWIAARARVLASSPDVVLATIAAADHAHAQQRLRAVNMVSSRRDQAQSPEVFGLPEADPFYVYIEDVDGGFVSTFPDLAQAATEYTRIANSNPIYVALFNAHDHQWPNPVNEFFGSRAAGSPAAERRPVAMSNPTGIISGHRGYQAPRGGGHWRAPFRDRLAYLAPVAYPAAAGAGIQFRFDGDALVASICVDGRCYEGRYDIGEILSRRGVDSFEQPVDPQTAQDAAQEVAAAGDVVVGFLLDDHVDQIVGGWWDDISKAVHGAERAITGTVASTLKTLKGPITQAAQMAIPALASVIPGGSMIAPMATKLVGELMTAATGSGPAKAQAQQAVAQVRQAAHAGDAAAKKALSLAQRAVAKSSTTYHAAQTAANAASGNPDAQQQIQELQGAASSGDQAANALLALIQKLSGQVAAASQAPGGQPATPAAYGAAGSPAADPDPGIAAADSAVDPNDPSATVAQVSGVAASGRQAASAVAVAEHLRSHAPAIAVVFQSNGAHVGLPMESLDAADDWMGRLEPGTFTYAAYFDPADPTWPAPINDRVGAKVVSAGWLAPVLAAAGGFGLGAAGWPFIGPKLTSIWGRGAAAAPASPTVK